MKENKVEQTRASSLKLGEIFKSRLQAPEKGRNFSLALLRSVNHLTFSVHTKFRDDLEELSSPLLTDATATNNDRCLLFLTHFLLLLSFFLLFHLYILCPLNLKLKFSRAAPFSPCLLHTNLSPTILDETFEEKKLC